MYLHSLIRSFGRENSNHHCYPSLMFWENEARWLSVFVFRKRCEEVVEGGGWKEIKESKWWKEKEVEIFEQ